MEKNIFKISCFIYLTSTLALMYIVFNTNTYPAPEILSYMQWWYSQPNTQIESFAANLGLLAFIISLIGVVALFFLQKWGAYLYTPSILVIVSTEWLNASYAALSSLYQNIDTVASISIGIIFCYLLFSEKLDIFKHNKAIKTDG